MFFLGTVVGFALTFACILFLGYVQHSHRERLREREAKDLQDTITDVVRNFTPLSLNDYQKHAREFARYPHRSENITDLEDTPYCDGLTYSILALTGEAGELANKLKKKIRAGAKVNETELVDELGDVLWYVSSVASELGYDLGIVAALNLEKLEDRRKKNSPSWKGEGPSPSQKDLFPTGAH